MKQYWIPVPRKLELGGESHMLAHRKAPPSSVGQHVEHSQGEAENQAVLPDDASAPQLQHREELWPALLRQGVDLREQGFARVHVILQADAVPDGELPQAPLGLSDLVGGQQPARRLGEGGRAAEEQNSVLLQTSEEAISCETPASRWSLLRADEDGDSPPAGEQLQQRQRGHGLEHRPVTAQGSHARQQHLRKDAEETPHHGGHEAMVGVAQLQPWWGGGGGE